MSRNRLYDWFLLLVCNLIWASQFVMVKLVQEQMGPLFAVFFPMAIATLLLIPIVRRERNATVRRQDIGRFVLIGVAGQVMAQLFITWGTRISLASNAALLSLALPVSTAVMAYFLLGERMTTVRWVSFACAIAGVLACSGVDWSALNFSSARYLGGNLMILASVCGSAFYNAYSKKLLDRYSPLQVLAYSYYAVIAFLLPITVYAEPESFGNLLHFSVTVWVGLVVLAFFQYFLSMVIFLNVLTRLDATQAAVSNYLIPFFGLLLAALILGEKLTTFMLAGGLLVLASTLLVTTYEERRGLRAALNQTKTHTKIAQ
jgi:drug/metabolite transporter (DMT)-like permease